MKIKNLDTIYHKLTKHILLAQAYTEIKELSFIIKSCRLKPIDYLIKRDAKVVLYDKWFDEFGNSLIVNSKNTFITYNDLSVNNNICTDLYYGLSIQKIMKISKLIHIITERDDEEYHIITFLGIDNYLRSYLYMDGILSNVSPLILGLDELKNISNNVNETNFIKLEGVISPGISRRGWLSSMPLERDFLELLNKNDEAIFNILNTKELEYQ